MTTPMTVEERLSALEKQIAELQQRLAALEPRASWLDRLTGSMKDFPEFEEVLRFGREIREADRPPDEPSAEG